MIFGPGLNVSNLPYFSDLSRFKSRLSTHDILPLTPLKFLFIGSFIKRKGFFDVLVAAKYILKNHPNAIFGFAGSESPPPALRKLSLEFSSSVILHGFVAWNNLPELYHSYHVIVVPSHYDGWGLVIPEALASSRPVIASSSMGSAIDLVEHDHNGHLLHSVTSDSIINSISNFINMDPQTYQKMCTNACKSSDTCDIKYGVDLILKELFISH